MKQNIIIVTMILLCSLTTSAQDFFFLGEKSYPCTETFTLQSNAGDSKGLQVLFALDGTKGLVIVRKESLFDLIISGKLIIYLEDGSVISCIDRGIRDYVDNIATAIYFLTEDKLTKMLNSNISTIRYSLEGEITFTKDLVFDGGGDYTASNTGNYRTNFPAVIGTFFYGLKDWNDDDSLSNSSGVSEGTNSGSGNSGEVDIIPKPVETRPEALFMGSGNDGPIYQGQNNGSGNAGIGFSLAGRDMVGIPSVDDDSQKEGKITLKIKVDMNGKVIKAEYTIAGSTTSDPYLKDLAIDAALKAKFNPDKNAPEIQQGTMTFVFKLK